MRRNDLGINTEVIKRNIAGNESIDRGIALGESSVGNLIDDLLKYNTVTVSSKAPIAKTYLLFLISKTIIARGNQVHYFDLDFQFSSIVSISKNKLDSDLNLYCCKDKEIIETAVSILSAIDVQRNGLVVVDSINTLQTVLAKRESALDFPKANHEAAILVSLFQEFAMRNSKLLLMTDVVTSKPVKESGLQIWGSELSGGRMIKLKSDVVLSVEQDQLLPSLLKVHIDAVFENSGSEVRAGKSYALELQSFT